MYILSHHTTKENLCKVGDTIEKLTYISDNGLFVVFEDEPPFLLTYIDTMSVGSIEDENMSIGGIYQTNATSYDRRSIPIEVAIIGDENSSGFGVLEQLKLRLVNTIDLNYQGELIYQNDTGTYSMRGRFKEIPTGSERLGNNERFNITFISTEQSKWKEKNERVLRMGTVIGGLSFPFTIDKSIQFGTYSTTFALINDTYDKLPVRIIVIGTAQSVTITNETTGKMMRFNRAISNTQQLEIDTETGTAFIRSGITGKVIENASHYLTLDSDYWYLQRGRNVITLDGGGQTTRPLGYLFWRKQYAGV